MHCVVTPALFNLPFLCAGKYVRVRLLSMITGLVDMMGGSRGAGKFVKLQKSEVKVLKRAADVEDVDNVEVRGSG